MLQYLARRTGSVVSSQDLADALWAIKPADPTESVAQCVKEIRRAMGDDARWMIKTVSGRGYAFQPEVTSEPPVPSPVVRPADSEPVVRRWPTVVIAKFARPRFRLDRPSAVAALLTALFVGAWLVWPRPMSASVDTATPTMMATPTVAVLPFTVLGSTSGANDPAAAFAASVRTTFRNGARGFELVTPAANQGVRPMGLAGGGARYVLSGTLWPEGDHQRVNVQLVDTVSGKTTWSESFQFNPGQSGASDRVAGRIARQLSVRTREVEARRPLPARPEADHYALQGMAILVADPSSLGVANMLDRFEAALALDASSILALQGFAHSKLVQVHNGWLPREQHVAMLAQAEDAIERMIKLDNRYHYAHQLRGSLLRARRDVDHAIPAFEYALSLSPHFTPALAELGRSKIDAGRSREAIGHLERAILSNPTDHSIYVVNFWAGMAALHIGDDQAAVGWLARSRQANRDYSHSAQLLAIAYVGLGEMEKAHAAMAEYRERVPRFSMVLWQKVWATTNPVVAEQRKRMENALRRLGVPEETAAIMPRQANLPRN